MQFLPADIIARKRDGLPLSTEEIRFFIGGFSRGEIPDYQMAALAMAIYLRGMQDGETADLTDQMLRSGTVLRWPGDAPPVVDKHSTGGIGDKVSLVLAPLLACCGLWVPMISGRGLGPTGGTLDKLESIPGFRTDLSLVEIQSVARRVGCVITGATSEIAPSDKKLYALRDVTATVASIPLITASIMSKKLAEGLDALVLDVKWGSGAFMKSVDRARELAISLIATGRRMGVSTTALLTDMNQPLGRMAGNAVEVNETLETLADRGPGDLVELTLALGAELLVATGRSADRDTASAILRGHLGSGAAREKFAEMVSAQGGSLAGPLRVAPGREWAAAHHGFVRKINTQAIGMAIIEAGGGRRIMSDRIDHSVGVEMLVRLGERVERGQPLLRLLAPAAAADRAWPLLSDVFELSDELSPSTPLITRFQPPGDGGCGGSDNPGRAARPA
jgi:pyrimidine-nucleoside phosphorylase